MAFFRMHCAQLPLDFNRTAKIRKQPQGRQFRVGKHIREAAAISERTYGTLAINKIVSEKAEIGEPSAVRRCSRIAKYAQHIFVFNRRDAFHQEVEVSEEVQHEVFVHYVWPVLLFDVTEKGWAE